jgi:2-polyprenyl-3-methyl-5-hydroxy-6-metoxy-1,4-benzoquinol methylase
METNVERTPDIASDEPLDDSWIRGYFETRPASDVHGPKQGTWKNVDFLRLRDVALHLLDPKPGMSVLDLGCSNGATMVYCGLQGATVYGQDLDARNVAVANRFLHRFKLRGEARTGDAAQLEFPDATFDGVISSDFMEHITDETKVAVLKAAYRVLKPGGLLITKTPNLRYLKASLLFKRLQAVAHFENPLRYKIPHTPGATPNPQQIGLTTRRAFTRCLHAAGFMNYQYFYAPLRRFGLSQLVEILSTEVPVVRDVLCEDLFCRAYKPIVLSHFPD